MRRLISSVTALALSCNVVPPFVPTAAMAEGTTASTDALNLPEGAFAIDLDGQTVICLPDKAAACPDGGFCVIAKAKKGCETKAAAKIAEDAAAAGGTAAETAAASDASAAPAETAVTETAPTDKATVDAAADSSTATDATAAPAEPAPATAAAETAETTKAITIGDKLVICLPLDHAVECPKGDVCVRVKTMDNCEAAATKKLNVLAAAAAEDQKAIDAAKAASDAAATAAEAAGTPLVDAPKPTDEAVRSLDTAIGAPATTDASGAATTATSAAAAAATADDGAAAADAAVTETTVTAADTRASTEEFAAAPATTADGAKKTGLSDLEKAGLVALGALAIGQMLYGNNGSQNEVVANSGDRVVVKDQSGNYQVYKDDDVLLKQPGSDVRTETFADGSTRTTVKRKDGSSVVTIRDASGRVLRRSAYDAKGIETALIDDTVPEKHVDVSKLPPAGASAVQQNASAKDYAHQFSLRQIRTIPEVKALAPTVKANNVTFLTGSAAIPKGQAGNLADLAAAMQALIKKNPGKVFLIEGHTDAVGGAPYNLTLSDRRAESVAKALTEYYGVPPENMVVQGYGESELKVDSQGDERANRRVVVRDVTQLLRQSKNT